MAEKQVKIKLGFDAEVEQAMQKIQKLSNTLNSIANAKISVSGGNLEAATKAAKVLNQEILKATNAETGKLDFSKLQTSLKSSGQDLNQLTNQLLAMGPKGQQAFNQVASAIATAELRTKKMNGTLAKFGTTLMNTIRWQASTALINAFTGAVQGAIGYIEDLDKSLNNIRIVTGKNTLEMASFAKMANQAAKELKTTTTEYTNASLIYFQQGLDTKEVLERTQATVKMAQVTGGAVEEVSNQLTAIWNNFDNGTKSLEYYADVITALGAATASSTEEISTGLEKFAAIAETVGLSYEYATAALATVTAETRQSAEVVGTAFKTLFARIQDLELGKTLEDGTTMGQYSEALMKVGINIKDANGGLKDMDAILNEMGAKWDTLTKDSQVALAQNVAGVRQYTQLMALMENWDTMQENVNIGKNAEGELDKQHKIYTSSLEALDDELKATAEGIYNKLLNPEMVADFKKALIEIVEVLDRIVDAAGGLKGMLQFGGLIVIQKLLPHLTNFMISAKGHLADMIGLTKHKQVSTLKNMANQQRAMGADETSYNSTGTEDKINQARLTRVSIDRQSAKLSADILDHKARLLSIEDSLTEEQKAQYQHYIDELEMKKEALRLAQEQQLAEEKALEIVEGRAARAVNTSGQEKQTIVDEEKRLDLLEERDAAIEEEKAKLLSEREDKKAQVEKNVRDEVAEETKSITDKKQQTEDLAEQTDQEIVQLEERIKNQQAQIDRLSKKKEEEGLTKAEEDNLNITKNNQAVVSEQLEETRSRRQNLSEKIGEYDTQLGEYTEEKIQERIAESASKTDGANASDEEIRQAAIAIVEDTREDLRVSAINEATTRQSTGKETKVDSSTLQGEISGLTTEGKKPDEVTSKVISDLGLDQGNVSSVENLEAIGRKKSELKTDAAIASDLSGELSFISKKTKKQEQKKPSKKDKGGKEQEKTQKETEKLNKTQTKLNETVKKYEAAWKAALQKIGVAGDELKKLSGESGELDLGKLNSEELDQVGRAMGALEEDIGQAEIAATGFGEAMAQDLSRETGEEVEVFEQVTEKAEKSEDAVNGVNEAQLKFEEAAKNLTVGDTFNQVAQGAGQALQSFTSFAMGATMMSTGVNALLDEEAGLMEKVSGAMMIAQGVQSSLNAVTALYNGLKSIGGGIALFVAKCISKETKEKVEDTAATVTNTGATTANAVSKVMAALASKGLAGILMGVAATAIIVGTVAMVANTVATEQNTKEKQKAAEQAGENAEKSKESAQALQEEYNELKKLTDEYEDALKIYEETGEGKADLISKAYETANALEIEGASLLILAGDYETLTKRIKEAQAAKAQGLVEGTKSSTVSSGASAIAKINSNGTGGLALGTHTINAQSGHFGIVLGDSEKDEFIDEFLKSPEGQKYADLGWKVAKGWLQVYYNSPMEMGALAKTLDPLVTDAVNWATNNWSGDIKESEFYTRYLEAKDNGDYDALIGVADAADAEKNALIEQAALETGLNEAETFEEYQKAYDNFIKKLEDKGIKTYGKFGEQNLEAINNYIGNNEALKDFKITYEAKDELKNKASQDFLDNEMKKWAQENGYSYDEALELFFTINPDMYATEESIRQAMDMAKDIVEGQRLEAKIDFYTQAKGQLKENMTADDWANFKTQNADLFDPKSPNYIGMSFEDFATMGYTNQSQALTFTAKDKEEAIEKQIAGAIGKQTAFQQYATQEEAMDTAVANAISEATGYNFTGGSYKNAFLVKQDDGSVVKTTREALYEAVRQSAGFDESVKVGSDEFQSALNDYTVELTGMTYEAYNDMINKAKIEATAEYESYNDQLDTGIQGLKDSLFLAQLETFNSRLNNLDLDEGEFDNYVNSLKEKYGDLYTDKELRNKALKYFEWEKGHSGLLEAVDEYRNTLADGIDLDNIDDVAAINAIKEQLAVLLGVDASELSNEFVKATYESGKLQEVLNGNYNTLSKMQAEFHNKELSQAFQTYVSETSTKAEKDEAYALMKIKLAEMLGVEYDQITDDLIKQGIESGNLQKAIEGDTGAVKDLKIEMETLKLKVDTNDNGYIELKELIDNPELQYDLKVIMDEKAWRDAMIKMMLLSGEASTAKEAIDIINEKHGTDYKLEDTDIYDVDKISDLAAEGNFESEEAFRQAMGLGEDVAYEVWMTGSDEPVYLTEQEYQDYVNGKITIKNGTNENGESAAVIEEVKSGSNPANLTSTSSLEDLVGSNVDKAENSVTEDEEMFGTITEGNNEENFKEPTYKEDYQIDKDEWEDKKKNIDEETERYYKLNKQLEQYNHELSLMDSEIEKAYGPAKLKLLDKKIDLQEKSLQTEKDLLDAMKETAKKEGKELKDLGGEFSEDGRLLNYDELMTSWTNEYNTEVDAIAAEAQSIEDAKYELALKRESMSDQEIHEAERNIEQREKALDKREKENDDKYKERTDSIKEYEDAWGDVLDQTEKVNDEINKIAEQHLEKINLEAELKLTITEVSRKEIDYYLGKIEDDFFSMAEGVALISSKAHLDLQDLSTYETKMNQILSDTALTAEQRAQALKELQDNFISSLQAVQEIDKQMLAYYGEALAASKEEFDSYASQLDNASSKLEHFSSLAGLIGKSYDRKYMGEILNAQYDVAKKNAEASKGYVDLLKQQKASIEKDLKTATGGQKELLEEELKAITQSLNEAEDEWLSDLEAMGEAAQAILENTLGKAREELEKSLYGTSIQDYIDSLDRLSAEQEGYLTETNKLYETNKLIRQAQMDMDKTSNIRAKQQYAEYIKQIEQKQKSGELSEYELSIAQAEFEVLQARIALEEAQSAKDQVRLTRDAEGNYGYVYTANANKVADAEQKLADAQNNLYNIGLDGYKEFTSKQAQLQQEALDAINEILEDETLSREEKEKKIAEIQEHYHTLMKHNEEQYQLAIGVMKENSYNNQLDYNNKSIVLADEFKTQTNGYLLEVEGAYDNYYLKVDSVATEVGKDLDSLKIKTGEVKTETNNLKTAIDNLNKNIDDELKHVRDRTIEWGKFRDTLKEAVEQNEKLMEVNGDMTRINSGDSTLIGKDISQQIMDYASTGGDNIEVLATYAASRSHKIAKDKDLYKQLKAGEILSTEDILKKAGYDEKTIKAVLDMANQSSLVASDSGMFFDTGGYTGSWGPEGRMAVLHEKEIVLNKQDTSNLLQAITMLREISNMIDRQAMYQSLSLLDSRMFDVFTERDNTLQQEVTIHAEFPNVNDHNEIEIALNDLITRASQYANRF